uniref:GrpE-like 1, mitochondrial n=1 Tax=Neogobius melanostomus TaxID=47308 RepID=A0A8C6UES7_9GOBI
SLSRVSPRLLCTATQQKNGDEEADRPEQSAAEKALQEEKSKLDKQLKDMTEKYKRALADTENLRTRSQKMIEDAKLYGKSSCFNVFLFAWFYFKMVLIA